MSGPFVSRFGKLVPADQVFFAWTSQDIELMRAALELPTNVVDRHHLLQCLVDATYRLRRDPSMRALCITTARQHLDELAPTIAGLRDHHRMEHEAMFPGRLLQSSSASQAFRRCRAVAGIEGRGEKTAVL